MSDQKQSRAEVICLYIEGHIKQKVAAKRTGLGTRQVRRLAKEFRLHGAKALIHGNRGKVSNRKIRDDIKHRITGTQYSDYGDTILNYLTVKVLDDSLEGGRLKLCIVSPEFDQTLHHNINHAGSG